MSTIYLRRAKLADLNAIMKIIEEARALLKQDGNPQWQDGHPDQKTVLQDISQEISWVLIVNGQVAGTVALMRTPKPIYQTLEDGHWSQPDLPYITIHRLALSDQFRGQGLGKTLLSNLITVGLVQGSHNFRLDTHVMNKRMQRLAENFGFIRRGTIHVQDKIDPQRVAYELNLQPKYKKVNRITNDFMKGLLK